MVEPVDTGEIERRRSEMRVRVSSMRATRKGERKPGFTAPHSPTLWVTAAMAARMVQASATLSRGPWMQLSRFSEA